MVDMCLAAMQKSGSSIDTILNRVDLLGNTILHMLVKCDCFENGVGTLDALQVLTDLKYGHGYCNTMLPYLIKAGANFRIRNKLGHTPLSIAARGGDVKIFSAVMDACKSQAITLFVVEE